MTDTDDLIAALRERVSAMEADIAALRTGIETIVAECDASAGYLPTHAVSRELRKILNPTPERT